MAESASFVLTPKLVAHHRAGHVLALSTVAFGRSFAVVDGPRNPEFRRLSSLGGPLKTAPGSIAVVDVFGVLEHRADRLCGWIDGYDAIGERIQDALNDRDVAGVMIRLDSPGGDAAGVEEAIRAINATRDASGKPVAVYIDELAASAGYWIASGLANAGVYAPPMAQIGSIGVYAPLVDETKSLEHEGIAIKLVRDPAGKDAANPVDPVTDLALARTQRVVSEAAVRFYSAVSTSRGIDVEKIRSLNADVFGAQEALSLGLIDGVKSFDQAIDALARVVGKQRMAGVRARLAMRSNMAKSKIRAAEGEVPPTDSAPAQATAADVAGSCRECEKACADCATACESGGADDAIASARACHAACGATMAQIESFLGMAPPVEVEAPEEQQAAQTILRLTGSATLAAFATELPAHLKAVEKAHAIEAEAMLEKGRVVAEQRRGLIVQLIELGAETPATAWEKDSDGRPVATQPVKRLADESIESMRERVAALQSTRAPRGNLQAPSSSSAESYQWAAGERERLVQSLARRGLSESAIGSKIAEYVATRSAIAARRKGN